MNALLKNLDGTESEVEKDYFAAIHIVTEIDTKRGYRFPEPLVYRERLYKRVGADSKEYDANGEIVSCRFIFQEFPGGKVWRTWRQADGSFYHEVLEERKLP